MPVKQGQNKSAVAIQMRSFFEIEILSLSMISTQDALLKQGLSLSSDLDGCINGR